MKVDDEKGIKKDKDKLGYIFRPLLNKAFH